MEFQEDTLKDSKILKEILLSKYNELPDTVNNL